MAILFTLLGFIGGRKLLIPQSPQAPDVIKKIVERPMDKYTFDTLRTTAVAKSPLTIQKTLKEEKAYTSFLFSHEFDPTFSNGKKKKVSGMINLPTGKDITPETKFPLIIMFRGYVDQSIYETGIGTRRSAEEFAKAGFMTLAPDFLGYGESDEQAGDVLEARFQAYTTALSIISNIDSLDAWDHKNVFLWGHSNGGLIALTVLELTSLPIPTVLWAPVTKPFPYSVLYYTDESEDRGKFLRNQIAKFEQLYDVEDYSFDNYLENIKAPIELHQGNGDDAVPIEWSNELVAKLKKQEIDVKYFTYPGADHNLQPGWDTVVRLNLEFFKKYSTL